jgi:hypothetical protein
MSGDVTDVHRHGLKRDRNNRIIKVHLKDQHSRNNFLRAFNEHRPKEANLRYTYVRRDYTDWEQKRDRELRAECHARNNQVGNRRFVVRDLEIIDKEDEQRERELHSECKSRNDQAGRWRFIVRNREIIDTDSLIKDQQPIPLVQAPAAHGGARPKQYPNGGSYQNHNSGGAFRGMSGFRGSFSSGSRRGQRPMHNSGDFSDHRRDEGGMPLRSNTGF